MFVSVEIHGVVNAPTGNGRDDLRFARLRADLDAFTEGRFISVAEHPYKKPTIAFMARLDPPEDEVWDIRSRDPRPGIRVLGCFAETDVFVALCWSHREDLGSRGSREWRDQIVRCKAAWRNLFPTYPPFSGASLHDYISCNIQPV